MEIAEKLIDVEKHNGLVSIAAEYALDVNLVKRIKKIVDELIAENNQIEE